MKASSDAKRQNPRTVCVRVFLSGLHLQAFCLDDVFLQKVRNFPSELQVILESLLICDRVLFYVFPNLLSECFTKGVRI
jgi:hypothetical protein